MDALDREIKNYIAGERAAVAVLGKRGVDLYPTEHDFYLFLTDRLAGDALEKMLSHLKTSPEDQALVVTARKLFLAMDEASQEVVPDALLKKVRPKGAENLSAHCPHCQKSITPFKRPASEQKKLNLLWLAGGLALFSLSFLIPRYFIQWVALGALCVLKWIVDQKSTKTQIMIYKALKDENEEKTRHLHRVDSNL